MNRKWYFVCMLIISAFNIGANGPYMTQDAAIMLFIMAMVASTSAVFFRLVNIGHSNKMSLAISVTNAIVFITTMFVAPEIAVFIGMPVGIYCLSKAPAESK